MQSAATTLTLQDIADIAHVRRPVVSMWRSRPRASGQNVPFPAPIAIRDAVEHFDRDEVVRWIERTNRGNNADFALDALAGAPPIDATLDDAVVLLCLAVAADSELAALDADDRLDLADECDPDDAFLFSETERLASESALAAYVDGVRSIAFGPGDALARLEASRLARGRPASRFDTAAAQAVAAVTNAIGTQRSDHVVMVDASDGDTHLALDVAAHWPEGNLDGLAIAGESSAARRNRRVALLRGAGPRTDREAAVCLLTVMDSADSEAIKAIDELQLSLPEEQYAVVIGPATLLCDVPDNPGVEAARDAIVRTGTLRLAARLPRGLWLPAPRKALGMWVFGSQSARKIEDRAVALADLGREDPHALPVDDLATDAVASLGDLHGRAFRFARVVRTSRLIAAREVVPAGTHAVHHVAPAPAEHVVRIEELVQSLGRDLSAPQTIVRHTGRSVPPTEVALGELLSRKAIRLVRGSRLDRSLASPDGTVRLLDPSEGDVGLGFDPLDLEANHPRATRSEPGDVVFTHAPRPVAYVDVNGGAVVASPARILRIRQNAPIGPRVLAHAINQMPSHAREWRTWQVPLVEPAQRVALEAELSALHDLRLDLASRLRQANELATELIDATTARAIDLTEGDTSATT